MKNVVKVQLLLYPTSSSEERNKSANLILSWRNKNAHNSANINQHNFRVHLDIYVAVLIDKPRIHQKRRP